MDQGAGRGGADAAWPRHPGRGRVAVQRSGWAGERTGRHTGGGPHPGRQPRPFIPAGVLDAFARPLIPPDVLAGTNRPVIPPGLLDSLA